MGEGCQPSWGFTPSSGEVGAWPKREAFQSLPAPALEFTVAPASPAQEFENAEGEEFAADFSAQSSPAAAQTGPDVYVLPLTEVSLPMAKQPGRSGE